MANTERLLDRHHRKPRSRQGKNDDRNISIVPVVKHRAWHILFGNTSATEIAKLITDVWVDPDYFFVAVPRKKRPPRKFLRTSEIECAQCGTRCTIKHTKVELKRNL